MTRPVRRPAHRDRRLSPRGAPAKRRRVVKTALKTRAHSNLTLILPLNVDTRRPEFAYRALRPGPITSRLMLHLTVMRHGRVFVRAPR